MTSTLLPILPAVDDVLFNFAQSDGFWANLAIAFGTSYDVVKATELRQQWKSRNFSQIPPIEVLSGEVLGTAKGAYSSSTNKIYLSASFLNTASSAAIVNVILEEIGHYVDAQINPVDSAGDEGEIFANLVSGKSLTPTELAQLKGENDHAVINLGGQAVEIEMAFSFGTTGYRQFGTSGGDSGSGVSSDSYGNIYVTGYTNGSLPGNTNFGNNDFFVAKYDVYGNRLWVKQFGSAYSDYATGISSESSGNTYVSGRTEGGEDAFVAKYNANGNQLWMAQFGTSGYDSATGVSSDGSGNVYVSGYTDGSFPSYTNLGSYDAFVAKYDTSGNPVWVKQFSTSSHDYAEGISSDSNGNVYVSGKTFGSFLGYTNLGLYDAFVAKYDGNGNQLWLRQFGTSGDDEITGISSDSSNNVYVTGSTKGGLPGYSNLGSYDAFVAKYDGNGNQLWLRQFGTSGNDEITGISRDIDNNVYVTGYTTGSLPGNINAGGSDAFVAKYNANGTLNWVRQFGTSAADSANGIRIDSSGNVYVTGDTSGSLPGNSNSGGSDAFVVGFDSDGNILNNIYSNNFETSAGSEWSKTNRSTTPIGGRKFLGEFSNDTVSLTLNNPLLNNNTITVEFDLFIIRYWDGNTGYADSNYGDATFTLTTSNGQTLFNTTFSNYDTTTTPNYSTTQSYPNSAGQGNYPARTGAVENNTLGYQNWYDGTKLDSVYHLTSTFTNASNPLSLNFTASGLGLWYNTSDVGSWGIDNISVRVLDVPTITLAVSPASVTEDGTSNLIYTFTRTGSTTNPLTVNYSVGGTATNGTDYASIPAGVIFAANSATATVTVDPTPDTTVESDETVALTLASGTGYTIGTTTAVTGTITNVPATSITLAVSPSSVTEDGTQNLIYTFTRTGSTTNPLTVNYSVAGTATNGTDYASIPTSVTFVAGSATATVIVDPTPDTTAESNETVILTLASGTGYTVGTTTAVTGTITNVTLPTITLAVSPSSVTEDGTQNLIYTFTRSGSTTNPLTVNYTVGGTATNGTDYASIPAGVIFAANSATATVIVDPTPDTTAESNETVILTLATGTGYTVGTTTAVTGTITNVPATSVTSQLSINDITVVEGQNSNAILTVTVNNPNPQQITVNYTTAPIDATANVDYTSQTGTLTIAANTSTATISIPLLNDNLNEPDEAFTVTLSNAVNATINPDEAIGQVIITDTLQSASTRTLPNNVENLRLIGSNNINGTGNASDNKITGNSGNNILAGANGNDIYCFNASTQLGSDTIQETTTGGIDTLDFTGTNTAVRVNLGTTAVQTVVTNNLKLTFSANNTIENIIGDSGNDRLTGNSLNNTLTGGGGNDQLTGQDGNDSLIGGSGDDLLTGGNGSDNFIFNSSNLGIDAISDFTPGSDKIVLSKAIFPALQSSIGNGFSQPAEFASVADDDLVATSSAFIVYSTSSGSIYYNQNGSAAGLGSGSEFANLLTVPTLIAADFALIN
jgi:Ca2+-binding RTX toxin-like protein